MRITSFKWICAPNLDRRKITILLFIIVFVIIKILTTKQEPSAKELFNLINASPQSFIKQNATASKLSTEELSLNGMIRTKIADTERNIYNADTTGK